MVRVRWMAGRVQQSCGRCQALNQLNPPDRIFRGLISFNFRGNLLREIALVRTLVVSISSTIFISSSLMFDFYMVFIITVGNICERKKMLFLREVVYELVKYGQVCCHKKVFTHVSASLSLIAITEEYECRLILHQSPLRKSYSQSIFKKF